MNISVVASILLLVSSSVVLADPSPGGRDAATQICSTLRERIRIEDCLKATQKHRYFDEQAVEICRRMDLDLDKINCLLAIGGKSYTFWEVLICGSRDYDFDSNRVRCLKSSGMDEESNCPFQY